VAEVGGLGAVEKGVAAAREEVLAGEEVGHGEAPRLAQDQHHASLTAAAIAMEGELGGGELEVEPAHVPGPALSAAGKLDGDEVVIVMRGGIRVGEGGAAASVALLVDPVRVEGLPGDSVRGGRQAHRPNVGGRQRARPARNLRRVEVEKAHPGDATPSAITAEW